MTELRNKEVRHRFYGFPTNHTKMLLSNCFIAHQIVNVCSRILIR